METNRDDFTRKTAEMLAKRVGYLCSNPNCRKLTIGSNQNIEKSTTIGIAAHITAAAPGGPRYDESLSEEQRKYIENGIWLCSNCASLIDKDQDKYSVELLNKWKEDAEVESHRRLLGEEIADKTKQPFIEVDLIWTMGGRWNRGFSSKNKPEIHEGKEVYIRGPWNIYFWDLEWNYNFVIYNNSMAPAYNLRIDSIGKSHFNKLTQLKKINNVPPLQNIDLEAKFIDYTESISKDADEVLARHIPDKLNNVVLRITYQDDNRKEHVTIVTFKDNEVTNTKE